MAMEQRHVLREFEDDYQSFLESEVGANPTDETWRIENDDAANWALRRIAQVERNMKARAEYVEREIDRLRRWQQQADEADRRSIEFFTSHLRLYFEQLREAGILGGRKSYKLPNGTLQVRAAGPTFIKDNQQLLAWAKSTGDETLVRITAEPAWSEIRKRIAVAPDGRTVIDAMTGEVVPGIAVSRPAHEEFSVKVEGGTL